MSALGDLRQQGQQGPATFEDVRREIKSEGIPGGRPLGFAFQAGKAGAHASVIFGWDIEEGIQRVHVADPLGPSKKVFNYEWLSDPQNQEMHWERTYFVQ